MKNCVKMLKVKIKSLAEEARIIRLEELRACGRRKAPARRRDMGRGFVELDPAYLVFVGRDDVLRESLHRHRIDVVRAEQRVSLLAYAFLRGKARAACEPKTDPHNPPAYARVLKLAEKFGPVGGGETKDQLAVRFNDWWQVAAAAAK